jgi:hypothetical protein
MLNLPHLEIYDEMSTHHHVCLWLAILELEVAH